MAVLAIVKQMGKKVEISILVRTTMKEMSGVVTLLLDGQMVCWNSRYHILNSGLAFANGNKSTIDSKKKKKKALSNGDVCCRTHL